MRRSSNPTSPALCFLLATLIGGPLFSQSSAQGDRVDPFTERHERMLAETNRLLDEVESSIFDAISIADSELDAAEQALGEAFEADTGAASASFDDFETERLALKAKVREWRTIDFTSTELVTHAREINRVRARATAIAEANGLNVEKLSRLYGAGLRTIRRSDFERAERPRPSRDERLSAYFASLFTFAWAEQAESEHIARNLEYKLGLYKRMSFAYLEALLSSGDARPDCSLPSAPAGFYEMKGRSVPHFDCPDPVVDHLRAYVDAVRLIQSGDADTFLALAEEVVAEQQLAADLLAAVPLVGDALDIYSVVSGENLAGQCLSPFERGLTGIFMAVPIVGPQIVRFTLKHSETAALALLKTTQLFGEVANIGGSFASNLSDLGADGLAAVKPQLNDGLAGVANLFGVSHGDMSGLFDILNTEIEITGAPRALGPEDFLSGKNLEKYRELQTTFRTLQDAKASRLRVSRMPAELRERTLSESAERMARNAANGAMETKRSAVIAGSNMVPAHVEALVEVAARRDEILIFRSVNPDATNLIEAHFATKGMTVKGKSADWGPHAGMIPVDQKFSKLGNPRIDVDPRRLDAADFGDIQKFHNKVAECLETKVCNKMEAVTGDGKKIFTVPDAGAGREMPVVFDGTHYLDAETGSRIDLSPNQLAEARPMEVLAIAGPDGEMLPLTADYDFLAIGDKGEITAPVWHDEMGAVTPQIQETLDDVNDSIRNRARHPNGHPYQGGNVVHHGPESWYANSPGALRNDPEITILDPRQGPILIKRCDAACMRQWCEDTKLCGGLRVCGEPAAPPCIPVDPDRILKDYFHQKRLEDYNLSPNSAWKWGDYNGIGGWTVDGFLREQTYLDWMADSVVLGPITRRAVLTGRKVSEAASGAIQYAFECTQEGR